MLTPLDLCSTDDHGHHLYKEKAVADNRLVYAPGRIRSTLKSTRQDNPHNQPATWFLPLIPRPTA